MKRRKREEEARARGDEQRKERQEKLEAKVREREARVAAIVSSQRENIESLKSKLAIRVCTSTYCI